MTKKSKKKEPVYKSMEEFEEAFIPESFRSRPAERLDLQSLAANMANEAVEKVRRRIAK